MVELNAGNCSSFSEIIFLHRYLPVNIQFGIIKPNTRFTLLVIKLIAFIGNNGYFAKH